MNPITPLGPAWLEDAPPPAYTPLGPAWLEATGFGYGYATEEEAVAAIAAPPPVWRQGSLGESGPFIGLGFGYTIELAKRIAGAAAAAAVDAFALKYAMLREMPDEPDPLDYTDAEIIDGMAWYSWNAERTRVWIQLLLGDALADEGISMGLLRALLDTPAADDALRPAIATLVRRLRILEGV
jgi:hypothetical protein